MEEKIPTVKADVLQNLILLGVSHIWCDPEFKAIRAGYVGNTC